MNINLDRVQLAVGGIVPEPGDIFYEAFSENGGRHAVRKGAVIGVQRKGDSLQQELLLPLETVHCALLVRQALGDLLFDGDIEAIVAAGKPVQVVRVGAAQQIGCFALHISIGG